ncbi:alpha/beta hydrolase [Clostridium sp. PL3]|uniref:Alpha/beta hydrolase n=1 Tax=Clostridium thailandense TaxID=2794346 RepID=A0A949U249_9CLOT|nr:alpha/beta hydrolase [Clostridium thailandense]MBV7275995.1 alpha/beta hydrolase [Clostridium thailandense]
MKKFLKRTLIVLVASLIIFIAIFHKRIILTYRLVNKYISLESSNMTSQKIDGLKMSKSMNYKDIIYKNTNGVPLTLDIYSSLKKDGNPSPVILYVHGGSWVYGDKSIPDALSPVLNTFREEGYTIICTSYELKRDKANFNKQVADVKDTIRWIYKNKSNYNLDPNEIGVIGVSSGAHLSLLASYSGNDEFTDDKVLSKYPSKPKYLIDFAGPTDLSLLNTSNLNYDLTRIFNSIKDKNTVIKKFNPINYVSKSIPNTLIIHSNLDPMVPYKSSKELYDKCIEEHSNVELITLKSSVHDLSSISNDDIISMSKGLLKFIILNSPL